MAQVEAESGQFSQIIVNGTQLAYRDIGKGDPLILVHGNISDARSWEPIENNLAERFRVIVYSRRYAWPNEPIADGEDDPWTLHADDLGALIEKLAIAPAHVLGNSTGAFVALLLARQKPELFRTLLLSEPPVLSLFLPSTPPTIGQVFKLLISQPWSFLPVMIVGATVVGPATTAFKDGDDEKGLQMFARGTLGSEFYDKLSDERMEQMRANVKPHKALFLGSGMPQFLDEDGRNITVPTLLIMGEKTSSFHQHVNRRLAVLISGAKESVILGASHLSHEDNPEGVFEAISSFVGV